MSPLDTPRTLRHKGNQLLNDFKWILRMVLDAELSRSYYPSETRKSKPWIFVDLLTWYVRHREVNTYYYVYGLDRRHGINIHDYLPYRTFRRIRNHKNFHPQVGRGYNYICLLQDKFVFSQFVSSLGFPTPNNLAICDDAGVMWLNPVHMTSLDVLLQDNALRFDGFCKPLTGINGSGAFPLKLADGQFFIKDEAITLADLQNKLDGKYLIQERVQQHPKMSELHPDSINTIRLMTFNTKGSVHVFAAGLRIGTAGRSLDNWTAGGILVGIDIATGRLHAEGVYKPGYGGKVREHPQTHLAFSGFEIPYFHDAVTLTAKLHESMYGIHSIGWDVAITEAGPTIIEGNDDWDGAVPMVLEKHFKQRFLELCCP